MTFTKEFLDEIKSSALHFWYNWNIHAECHRGYENRELWIDYDEDIHDLVLFGELL